MLNKMNLSQSTNVKSSEYPIVIAQRQNAEHRSHASEWIETKRAKKERKNYCYEARTQFKY